ncbi:glycosyltransferase family 2 protein [Synechococcus sp. MIT S1220]|uniref:glycosyltransferase family 2 protein n=1 Tax=Synechococcus sp. MIT S1220 TaxID=3082549 RepID=UPI0039AED77F
MASLKLVAIAKDEAAYLPEWIYHHLRIGFDEIDVYLNGITDNSFKVMRRICARHSNVNFYNADSLVGISNRAKRSFQHVIYRFAWKTEQSKRNFSHLAFLDIDEYLLSESFDQNVKKMFRSAGQFDVLSNLWYSDLPGKVEPFSRFFVDSLELQKMSVVKSVGRLSSNLGSPMVHNFTGIKRKPHKIKSVLSNGATIQYSALGKRLSDHDVERCASTIEPWFVFHRIYRSHLEYCASLMRGRKHRANDAPIKDNRFGYVRRQGSRQAIGKTFRHQISSEKNSHYQRGFEKFLDECNLENQLEVGRESVRKKFRALEALLQEQPDIIDRYSNVFNGTVFEKKASS